MSDMLVVVVAVVVVVVAVVALSSLFGREETGLSYYLNFF